MIVQICAVKFVVVMLFGLKCSVLNVQVAYVEIGKLNISNM